MDPSNADDGGRYYSLVESTPAKRLRAAHDRGRWKKRLVYVVLCSLFADYLLVTMVIPILPELYPEGTISPILYGVLFASKPAIQVLANPFVGRIIDARGPRGPVAFGLLVVVASTLLFGLSASSCGELSSFVSFLDVAAVLHPSLRVCVAV